MAEHERSIASPARTAVVYGGMVLLTVAAFFWIRAYGMTLPAPTTGPLFASAPPAEPVG